MNYERPIVAAGIQLRADGSAVPFGIVNVEDYTLILLDGEIDTGEDVVPVVGLRYFKTPISRVQFEEIIPDMLAKHRVAESALVNA